MAGIYPPNEDALSASENGHASHLGQVLEAFDELVERDAELATVLSRAATLLERPVGMSTADDVRMRAEPDGVVHREDGPTPTHARHSPDGTRVWLEGPGLPDEGLILRRLSVTLKIAARRDVEMILPANEVIFDPERTVEARLRAARQLGLSERARLTVIGVQGREPVTQEMVSRIRDTAAFLRTYHMEGTLLLVATGVEETLHKLAVPIGSRTAVAHGVQVLALPDARWRVGVALRYALPAGHDSGPYPESEAVLVDTAALGGYLLLPGNLTPQQIDTVDDVQGLDSLRTAGGEEMLQILEAVAATESVRKAARIVHLHHNSVAARIEQAEETLGFSFVKPYGRTRLFLALCMRRIRDSAAL